MYKFVYCTQKIAQVQLGRTKGNPEKVVTTLVPGLLGHIMSATSGRLLCGIDMKTIEDLGYRIARRKQRAGDQPMCPDCLKVYAEKGADLEARRLRAWNQGERLAF